MYNMHPEAHARTHTHVRLWFPRKLDAGGGHAILVPLPPWKQLPTDLAEAGWHEGVDDGVDDTADFGKHRRQRGHRRRQWQASDGQAGQQGVRRPAQQEGRHHHHAHLYQVKGRDNDRGNDYVFVCI